MMPPCEQGGRELNRIRWLDSFEMGIPAIDDDHRALIEKAGAIQDAIEAGNTAECCRMIGEFMNDVRAHFTREEACLAECGYPGAGDHKRNHGKLLARGMEAEAICREGRADRIMEGMQEMIGMLIGDMVESDYEFKSFLQDHMNIG